MTTRSKNKKCLKGCMQDERNLHVFNCPNRPEVARAIEEHLSKLNKNSIQNSSNSSKGSGNTKQIPPSKHWCFTLNNYTLEDINSIKEIVPKKRFVFQEETGEEGTKHLQGYIEFQSKLRPLSLKLNPSIHWEKCRSIKLSIEYCQKEDTRTGEIFLFGIKRSRTPRVITEDQLYSWQKEVVNIAKQIPDERTIHWYWSTNGNIGKTSIVRYLQKHHDAIITAGKASDMKFQIVNFEIDKGYYPELILCDIPREAIDYLSYSGLEQVKNGSFGSSKYMGVSVLMDFPHIICFANTAPILSKMSEDRWHVVCLDENEEEALT